VFYGPKSVNFDKYFKPVIKKISAGGYHTGFVDEIGRLFTCGKNDQG
jgi:alpha-tubulin suppressor-like RCC1 family protein